MKNISRRLHNRNWYLLVVLSKISDEQLRSFRTEVFPGCAPWCLIVKSPVLNFSLSFPQVRVLTSVRNVRGRSFVLLTFKDIYAITQGRNRTSVKSALGHLHALRTWSVICARTQARNPINAGSAPRRSLSQGVYRLTCIHIIRSHCKLRVSYRTRQRELEINARKVGIETSKTKDRGVKISSGSERNTKEFFILEKHLQG